ncbi:MAG: hypothetical protein ACKVRP_11205 [Bacteroidota bacterium]
MKNNAHMLLAGLAVTLTIATGCEGRFNAASDPVSSLNEFNSVVTNAGGDPRPDTIGCATAIGVLLPTSNLTLSTLNSQVKYNNNSVLIPTSVCFSICDLDTTAIPLIPRAFIFGATPDVAFLQPVRVRIDAEDAGLPADLPSGIDYFLFRKNDLTGTWELQQQLQTDSRELDYFIRRNGVYAISFDTTWVSSAVIGPGGGTVSVRTASLVFPPGALTDTATIVFRMSASTPNDLPGGLNRLYEFGPEGITFQSPITLYIPFVEAGLTRGNVNGTKFYYHNQSTHAWELLPSEIDRVNQRLVVRLSHFSRYAFAR